MRKGISWSLFNFFQHRKKKKGTLLIVPFAIPLTMSGIAYIVIFYGIISMETIISDTAYIVIFMGQFLWKLS